MKKLIYITLIAAAAVFSSCSEDLLKNEQLGTTGETTENFYVGDDAAREAVNAAYYYTRYKTRKEPNWLWYGLHDFTFTSDEYISATDKIADGKAEFNLYTSKSDYLQDVWETLWRVINACNRVTDNFSEGLTPAQAQYNAEANVLKAWAYMLLVEYWGCPPLLKRVPVTDEEFKPKNSTKEEVNAYIMECLNNAIDSGALPQKANADDKVVRVTKEFALALKGKLQVFTGDYAGAKETLKKVVTSDKYRLMTAEEFHDKFCNGSAGRCNCEEMFELYCNPNGDAQSYWYMEFKATVWWPKLSVIGYETDSYVGKVRGKGSPKYTPNEQLIKDMLKNEGWSKRFKSTFFSYQDYVDLGMHTLSDPNGTGAEILARTSYDVPTTDFAYGDNATYLQRGCGFWIRKGTPNMETDLVNNSYGYTCEFRSMFRLTEAYLLYAEACAMTNDNDGLKYLNAIAERAGYANGFSGYSACTLANVQNEKRFEMFGEFTRRSDLIRWGLAESLVHEVGAVKPVFFGYKNGKTKEDLLPDGSNVWDVYEVRHYDVKTAQAPLVPGSFITGVSEVLPFPYDEISNNYNLVQNPGYAN